MSVLKLINVHRQNADLSFSVKLEQKTYSCSYHYQDVCFEELEQRYGKTAIDSICFHIVAFEMAKYCSLAPKEIHFGSLAPFVTSSFFSFWQEIVNKIWSQWRYQNNRPDYSGPSLQHALADLEHSAITERETNNRYLLFCGGGKDSLVAMRILDRHDIPYSSYIYSHSVYGDHEKQLSLLTGQIEKTGAQNIHVQRINDELMDTTRLGNRTDQQTDPAPHTITHAETPCSIFGALPLILSKGYQCSVLAHERSADMGNLIWSETGEEVNHQWGKSWQAEELINQYVKQYLVSDFSYFSILKPITDVVIFNLLKHELELLPYMHSCNIEKPWCKKCAKCAYVWLNLKAYLPNEAVDDIFKIDLFDVPENDIWFRQMLGLAEHTPFECVGQVPEARLALELYLQTNDHPKAQQLRSEFDEDFNDVVISMTQPSFDDSNLDADLEQEIRQYFLGQTKLITVDLLQRLKPPADSAALAG